MDDTPKKPAFGTLQLPAIDARLSPGLRTYTLGPRTEWVPYATRLQRGTVLRLAQAAHYLPGGVFQAQAFFEKAINAYLDQFPEADKPLPEAVLAALLRRNAKLRTP